MYVQVDEKTTDLEDYLLTLPDIFFQKGIFIHLLFRVMYVLPESVSNAV